MQKKAGGKKKSNCAFSLVMMGKAAARRRKDNLEIEKKEGKNPRQLLFNFKRDPHILTLTVTHGQTHLQDSL